MKMDFDGRIRLEFHDARVTSNGGLLAYRDPYDVVIGNSRLFLQKGDSGFSGAIFQHNQSNETAKI